MREDNNVYESPVGHPIMESSKKSPLAAKVIITLLAVGVIAYVVFNQFFLTKELNTFYDFGNDNHLTPAERVIVNQAYDTLNHSLVYIDVPIPSGATTLTVDTRFKNNLPEGWSFNIGARDQEIWSYQYKSIYSKSLDSLKAYPSKDNVYRIDPSRDMVSLGELKKTPGIAIATDESYNPQPAFVSDFTHKETVINTTLRGGHIFYVYAENTLTVSIIKQDINWYDGADPVILAIYTLDDKLIASTTIADDGIVTVDKLSQIPQEGEVSAKNLKEGVYKVKISDGDMIIKQIKLTSNKVIAQQLFLADNELYNTPTVSSTIFTKSSTASQIRLITYHLTGLQDVQYSKEKFSFNKEDTPVYMDLPQGSSMLMFPKNDIIISGHYFAFSEENYFEPFVQKVVSLNNDLSWINGSVDYVVSSYKSPVKDGDWLIGQTEFNLKDLYVKGGKLSMVFYTPHLGQEDFANYTIPVDWINVTVHKPGVFSK